MELSVDLPDSIDSTDPASRVASGLAPAKGASFVISDVIPLSAQIKPVQAVCLPPELHEVFFGDTHPGLLSAKPEDPAQGALFTYAVLDAAQITNLVEMLDVSDLEHRCLFKGDAGRDLSDVAPWLVRLEEGNKFTRNLFTRSDAGWHLWDSEAGIFVRSKLAIDDLRAHFRRFTKVRDAHDKWLFFRFWQARYLHHLLLDGDHVTRAQLTECGAFLTHQPEQGNVTLYPSVHLEGTPRQAFQLREADLIALRVASSERFISRMEAWLTQSYGPLRTVENSGDEGFVLSVARRAWQLGLSSERAIADFAAASWLMGQSVDTAFDLTQTPQKRLPARLAELHSHAAKQNQLKADQTRMVGA